MTPKALFLDRDGVVNEERNYVFVSRVFSSTAFSIFCRAAIATEFNIIIVTNQAGIARGLLREKDFAALTDWMRRQLRGRGRWSFAKCALVPCHPTHGIGEYRKDAFCRKDNPGMIIAARNEWDMILREKSSADRQQGHRYPGRKARRSGAQYLVDAAMTGGSPARPSVAGHAPLFPARSPPCDGRQMDRSRAKLAMSPLVNSDVTLSADERVSDDAPSVGAPLILALIAVTMFLPEEASFYLGEHHMTVTPILLLLVAPLTVVRSPADVGGAISLRLARSARAAHRLLDVHRPDRQ